MAKKKEEKPSSAEQIAKLLKTINGKYGTGTLLPASQAKSLVMSRIPIGIPRFDVDSGGGIPRGRITVVKGEFSAGKTALCMKAVAAFQRHCRFCAKQIVRITLLGEVIDEDCDCGAREPMKAVWHDAEHSFDKDWAARWGIDVDQVLVVQTEYAEQGIDVTDLAIRSGAIDLVVVDSVAALTPAVEVEESSEKWQMGVAARLMNKALRKWTSGMNSAGLLSETQCTIMLINQMRLNIGGYGAALTSPGGKGIDFYESMEVRLKKAQDGWVEDPLTGRAIALDVEYLFKKNKTAPAMRTGMYRLYFVDDPGGGFGVGDTNYVEQIINMAAFWGIMKKGGSWYTLPDGQKAQGVTKAAALLVEDESVLADIEMRVWARELAWTQTGDTEGVVEQKKKDEDDDG